VAGLTPTERAALRGLLGLARDRST
jgi:hypothetical protein